MRRALIRSATAVILLGLLAGCGYRLVGMGNALPEHLRRIVVPLFRNRTFEYGIESAMTYAVIDELERRQGIEIVEHEHEADATFEVVLKDYDYHPLTDGSGQVTQYRIRLVAEVIFRDLVAKEIFWEDPDFSFTQTYFVSGDLSSYEDNRAEAWEEASEDFAESIVGAILEGF